MCEGIPRSQEGRRRCAGRGRLGNAHRLTPSGSVRSFRPKVCAAEMLIECVGVSPKACVVNRTRLAEGMMGVGVWGRFGATNVDVMRCVM